MDLGLIPVVDNHVHPWRAETREIAVQYLAGSVAFSDTVVTSVRSEFLPLNQLAPELKLFRESNLGVSYLRRELARFLKVEDDWTTVVAARNQLTRADYRGWTGRLFEDVGLDTLLVDEGGSGITLSELRKIVPVRPHPDPLPAGVGERQYVKLRRVARTDNFIRDLLTEEHAWPRFLQRYDEALDDAIKGGAIAFKSVIAYRTGLDIQPVTEANARHNYEAARNGPESAQKPLRDFLFCHTLDVARERGLFVHVHAAAGDPDIVYHRSNPALLYPLLHSERFRNNKVVLIHGGWPWVGEAAAMVAILPNVYLDVSEGTIFGMPNMRQRLLEAIEACPYTKILYGADGSLPEALWIVAKRFKLVLARVLDDLVAEGFCSDVEALEAARCILSDNAVRLYGL